MKNCAQIGERIHISNFAVVKPESGSNSPSDQNILLIEKEFDVNPRFLENVKYYDSFLPARIFTNELIGKLLPDKDEYTCSLFKALTECAHKKIQALRILAHHYLANPLQKASRFISVLIFARIFHPQGLFLLPFCPYYGMIHPNKTYQEAVMKKFLSFLLLFSLLSSSASALDYKALLNPPLCETFKDDINGVTIYYPKLPNGTSDLFQVISDAPYIKIRLIPELFLISSYDSASIILQFEAVSLLSNMSLSSAIIKTKSARYRFNFDQTSTANLNDPEYEMYSHYGKLFVGTSGKKMLKDICVNDSPVFIRYYFNIDGNSVYYDTQLTIAQHDSLCIIRDLYIDCGAINDDMSFIDENQPIKIESL